MFLPYRLFLLLTLLLLAGPAWAQEPSGTSAPATAETTKPSKWSKEIEAFEAADRDNPPPKNAILFIGSSSIRLWKEVAQDFPRHQVINRGFGGSVIADSVEFIPRIVLPYEPRQIFFYAGGNDIASKKKPEVVAADFRSFAAKVHAKLPNTEMAFISIAPNPKRWSQMKEITEANALIKMYCETTPHLKYIDIHPAMLGPDGQPKEGIFREDGLHMNRAGYKLWVEVLTPHLLTADK